MLEMAIKVARGKKFFNHFETEQTGVLIVDEESGERLLQERIKLLQTDENLPIYYLSRNSRKMNEEYVNDILETCHEKGIKLVMFDSLIRFHSADENASSQMSQVLDCFKRLADAGVSCLVLHHNKKKTKLDDNSGGELMRGSSDILASCDIHTVIKKKEKKITIYQTKNRYCEEISPFSAEFKSEDDKCEFRWLGFDRSKEDWENLLKTDIWGFVMDNPNMKKTECVDKFYEYNDRKDGKQKIARLIEAMIKDGYLELEKGAKNAKYLRANDGMKNEIPQHMIEAFYPVESEKGDSE
jgi:hypothetical protein